MNNNRRLRDPFYTACLCNSVDLARLLYQNGAPTNVTDGYYTAFSYVVSQSYYEIVEFMIENNLYNLDEPMLKSQKFSYDVFKLFDKYKQKTAQLIKENEKLTSQLESIKTIIS